MEDSIKKLFIREIGFSQIHGKALKSLTTHFELLLKIVFFIYFFSDKKGKGIKEQRNDTSEEDEGPGKTNFKSFDQILF